MVAAPARLRHPVPWIALIAVWLMIATAPPLGPRQMLTDTRDRRPAVLILLALVIALVVAVVDFSYRENFRPLPLSLPVSLGVALMAAGLALCMWSIRVLGRFFTATVRIAPDQRVVDEGPYRLLRHPSYTGAMLTILGIAIALG